ncbi:hypothetical protein B0H19DRAFT_528135 [Mycena capillaripes]|nr:hypothetical protein B0H19DRAFT_528135 [Mycena capillaripes]
MDKSWPKPRRKLVGPDILESTHKALKTTGGAIQLPADRNATPRKTPSKRKGYLSAAAPGIEALDLALSVTTGSSPLNGDESDDSDSDGEGSPTPLPSYPFTFTYRSTASPTPAPSNSGQSPPPSPALTAMSDDQDMPPAQGGPQQQQLVLVPNQAQGDGQPAGNDTPAPPIQPPPSPSCCPRSRHWQSKPPERAAKTSTSNSCPRAASRLLTPN